MAACLIIEIGLRLYDPFGIDYVTEHERLLRRMPIHPRCAYTMPASMSDVFQGVRIETNSLGLRGKPFPTRKAPGAKRILLVGDSVVVGWGVEQSQMLGTVLERLLNQAGDGASYEVINVAALSWNTRNQAEFLKEHERLWDADAMVMVVVSNDIVPKPVGACFVPRSQLAEHIPKQGALARARLSAARHSRLLALLHRLVLVRELGDLFAQCYEQGSPACQDASHAFAEIVALGKRSEMAMLGYLYFMHGEQASTAGRRYEDFYGGLFRQHGLEYFTFPKEIYSLECRNSVIDPHQNARGLEIMAHHLAETLIGRKPESQRATSTTRRAEHLERFAPTRKVPATSYPIPAHPASRGDKEYP
jgi:hypothetical protein